MIGTEWWNRLIRTLSIGQSTSVRPLPPVVVRAGRTVPGWALRATVVVVALGFTATLATVSGQWILAIIGVSVMIIRPAGGLAQAYALALGIGLAIGPTHPFAPRAFVLLFGIHLLVALGSLATGLGWNTRVEWRLIALSARRFAVIQAACQVLALAAAWITDHDINAIWLTTLAGLSIAVLGSTLARDMHTVSSQQH
jgi:hypothetical protein